MYQTTNLSNDIDLDQPGTSNNCLQQHIGCLPQQLEERHALEIFQLLKDMLTCTSKNKISFEEKNFERFQKLIELYSEEPQLLDPILKKIVDFLLQHIDWKLSLEGLSPTSLASLIRLKLLSRVVGYKKITNFLPHQPTLLEDILLVLEHYSNELISKAQEKTSIDIVYILAIWLLIILKNPLSLQAIEGIQNQSRKNTTPRLPQRIVNCLTLLRTNSTFFSESNILVKPLTQVLTRDKDNSNFLKPTFDRFLTVFTEFQSEFEGGIILIRELQLAISLLKQAKRAEIRPYAMNLFSQLPEVFMQANCINSAVRNLVTKFLQRIGLIFLRPQLATWRYKRGYRSLQDNLKEKTNSSLNGERNKSINAMNNPDKNQNFPIADFDVDEEIPYDYIEAILGLLLQKTMDSDNVVRWTAAKGIARICSRIPQEMAAEVVSSIMTTNFEKYESATWHGGCLALAELLQRGCLLPDQVPPLIQDVLESALIFEGNKIGYQTSVGVRDAACYICWAFSRAYTNETLMAGNLPNLGGTLVCLALFDREVNIRRASSAAFQENVGRNDVFPHGIQILTIADYTEVTRIRNCYLDLSVRVAKYREYVRPMINHLCKLKSRHWDEDVRVLASQALEKLAPFDPEYCIENILPDLFTTLQNDDPSIKHGTMFAIAGLLLGLYDCSKITRDFSQKDKLIEFILQNSYVLSSHRYSGYILLAKAISHLIGALCQIQIELSDSQLLNFHDILDIIISEKDKKTKLQVYAAKTLDKLMKYYHGERFELLMSRIQHKYMSQIVGQSMDENARCSSILPLSYLDSELLKREFVDSNGSKTSLFNFTISRIFVALNNPSTPTWVFVRVVAIQTIRSLLLTFVPNDFCWSDVFENFLKYIDDYTTTTNGDIGRYCRKAVVEVFGELIPFAFSTLPNTFPLIDVILGKIIERCCEPNDEIRQTACLVIEKLLLFQDGCLPIREREILSMVFIVNHNLNKSLSQDNDENKEFEAIDWRHSKGFVRLGLLLTSTYLRHYALTGFFLSIASIASWTSQNAFLALTVYLRPHKTNYMFIEQFTESLLEINNKLQNLIPNSSHILKVIPLLANDRFLSVFDKDPDSSFTFKRLCEILIQFVNKKGKPKVKLEAINALGSLLQINESSELYKRIIKLLLSLLTSPYSALREAAAEQLFEHFTLFEDISSAKTDETGKKRTLVYLLSETDWSKNDKLPTFQQIKKEFRDSFCID